MGDFELFPKERIVGVFRGFREGGLEFHADLVLPYRNDFQSIPMHGQFLLVQLETPDEAVLGRIASLSSEGKLTSSSGEEFNIRAVREDRAIPEDLREQYLRYRVNIRVLGVLRRQSPGCPPIFVPSHRRLPHVGSPVAFPGPDVMREIAGHNIEGAELGHLALGEYIYAKGAKHFDSEPWMQLTDPEVLIKFPVESLVSRRSFVFARAGFGKSNLTKLLFGRLYEKTPTVTKRGNREVPVGTLIFDPDGEYFWPDDKGRPGLCDLSWLVDKLVVFTPREAPNDYYQSFVAGGIKLDIRDLRPRDVIAIALDPERQDQQNVQKLKALNQPRWTELVNLIDRHRNQTAISDVCRLLDLDEARQEMEALAARSNMTNIVNMLHDRSSLLMHMLVAALKRGKLCVIDVSQMRRGAALILSGIILRRIFDRNQEEFTKADPESIPTIAVIEEAQAVLNERATAAEPYIAWVKEGRKYDLGAVMITQQPGSIPHEILSQGDNWFLFHLLSADDLSNIRKANAHFGDDILSSLLNEPIVGQGVFWSSAGGKPYPVSLRVLSFESMVRACQSQDRTTAAKSYASELKREFADLLQPATVVADGLRHTALDDSGDERLSGLSFPTVVNGEEGDSQDAKEIIEARAISTLLDDRNLMNRIKGDGAAWGAVKAFMLEHLPEEIDDRDIRAYHLVRTAMTTIFGDQGQGWHTFKHPSTGSTWVKAGHPS